MNQQEFEYLLNIYRIDNNLNVQFGYCQTQEEHNKTSNYLFTEASLKLAGQLTIIYKLKPTPPLDEILKMPISGIHHKMIEADVESWFYINEFEVKLITKDYNIALNFIPIFKLYM